MFKQLLALLTAVSLAACVTACASSGKSSDSSSQSSLEAGTTGTRQTFTAPLAAPQRPGIKDTYDEDDSASRKLEENDDQEIEIYGRPASPAERQSAIAFAQSYFAAAAAENGAAACQLLVPSLASSLGGKYEKAPNPSYLGGKNCTEVMTKLFEHRHKLMAAEAAGLEVTDVRVTSRTAFILLAFKGIRERRYMGVERDGNMWKLEALIDSQYP